MLNRDRIIEPRRVDAVEPPSSFAIIGPADILRVLRRQWPVIAATTGAFVLLGALYLITAAPKFTASMTILIDTRKTQLFQTQQVLGETTIDASGVESQAEIMRSDTIALKAIRDLKLTEDPEFVDLSSSFFGTILSSLLGREPPQSTEYLERLAIEKLLRNLQVKRVGLTYAIEVSYTSLAADKSAKIANALGEAYLVGELDSRYQATLRASKWLQDRMGDLREQASKADTDVQQFKAENNIIETGRGLISDQQLSDVNTQLLAARATTAEAKARLDRIQSITLDQDSIPDATVADALRNDVITRLRAQLLDLSAREADWSSRYGKNHAAATNLRNQMREIRLNISSELRRIAETYKSDYEIARAREQSMADSYSALVGQTTLTSQAQIKLRDLESKAQSLRNLYDNFLQRFMEATQQQTFPITEARIITPASEPLRKSAPKSLLILAASLLGGLMIGGVAAFVREQMDNVFRTAAEMEEATGIECLGILPRIDPLVVANAEAADPARRILRTDVGINRHVVAAPFSRFTETLRSVKVAIDMAGLRLTTRVIGVASALPQEGKTTVASNLAQLIATTKQRVILIDADLRNPALTRALVPEATAGLIEVIQGKLPEHDVIWQDPVTGLHVLPTVLEARISHTADLISSDVMARLLSRLRERYDCVILDLPPVLPVVDVRAASHLIDGFVYVAAWGKTQKDVVADALSSIENMPERTIGSVLNGAGQAMLRRLEASDGRYYADYHHGYGHTRPPS